MPVNKNGNIELSIDLQTYLQDSKPIIFEGADPVMILDRQTGDSAQDQRVDTDTAEIVGYRFWLTFSYRGFDPQTGRSVPLSYKIKYWSPSEDAPFVDLEGERVKFVNGIMMIGSNGYARDGAVMTSIWESYRFDEMVLADSKVDSAKEKEVNKGSRFDTSAAPTTAPATAPVSAKA